jgi:hypothetical protein
MGARVGAAAAAHALGHRNFVSSWPWRCGVVEEGLGWWRALSGGGEWRSIEREEARRLNLNDVGGSSWRVEEALREFQRRAPIEEASTPPSAWYTDAAFADFEIDRVFGRGWQAVGEPTLILLLA